MVTVKKVLAYGTPVLVSTVLTVLVGALLPAGIGLALFVAGCAVMVLLLLGAGEGRAIGVLYRARVLTTAENAALAPALSLLCQRGLPMGVLRIRVQHRAASVAAAGVGRHTVIVTAGMVAAVRGQRLPAEQAAALLGHAAGVVLSGAVRSYPALQFWTQPWRAARGFIDALSTPFRRLPLLRWTWRGRIVVGVVAAVQAAQADQRPVAAGILLIVGVSYGVTPAERCWADVLGERGDARVSGAGLAEPWSRLLLSCSNDPNMRERVHVLAGPAERPRLVLVSPPPGPSVTTSRRRPQLQARRFQ